MSQRRDASKKVTAEEQRAESERYMQELILKESALRRKERDHGSLEKRMRELETRGEDIERYDRETDGRIEALKKREAEFEVKQAQLMRQYEDLLRPLIDREQDILEREKALQAKRQEDQQGFKAEMRGIQEMNDKAKVNEERTRSLQQHALESKSRSLRMEQELERMKEELANELKAQKKRTEEIESRARELEWKERENVQEQKRQTKRDVELRREMDAVETAREELSQRETASFLKEAKLAEQKLQLKERTKQVCVADEEVTARAKALAAKEKELEEKQSETYQREAAARQLSDEIHKAEAILRGEIEDLQRREGAVAKQEQQTSQRLAALEESEKELLEWMRETAWREQAVARSEEVLARVGVCATGMAQAIPANPASPREPLPKAALEGDVTSACVRRQLREMKASYLCALSKQSRGGTLNAEPGLAKHFAVPSSVAEKDKYFSMPSPHARSAGGYSRATTAATARKDLFMMSVEEEAKLDENETTCRVEATRFSRYLSRLPFLESRWEELPISADDPSLNQEEATFLRSLSEDNQRALRQALLRERELAGELLFLKTLTSTPLLKRRNCQPDSTVVREMEAWYIKSRTHLHQRYSTVLEERATVLQSAVGVFAEHTGSLPDRTGRVDLGYPYTLPKHRAKDRRYKQLVNRYVKSGAQGNTVLPPFGKEGKADRIHDDVSEVPPHGNAAAPKALGKPKGKSPRRGKANKLAPLDACLHNSKVRNLPFSNYLQHYFDGLDLASPPTPPDTPSPSRPASPSVNHVEEPLVDGEGEDALGEVPVEDGGDAANDEAAHSGPTEEAEAEAKASTPPAAASPTQSASDSRSRSRSPSQSSAASSRSASSAAPSEGTASAASDAYE
eukprot:TRINITY_DN32655_c0_g1_i1.p1 TRINITY_DN32655_c0_g1~~TRINITY_DN32655_c0_g1_i1.p1  ORF type:complete len:882 (+),score=338.19 TRINITY_DN32655_c0_g1_i1:58-2646(+)